MELPIEKVTTISTEHISEADGVRLSQCSKDSSLPTTLPRIESHRYGWMIFVPSEAGIFQEYKEGLRVHGFSLELRYIFSLAHELSISLINFDQDGELCGELHKFDW